MRTASCQQCNATKPLGELFEVQGRVLCEPCGNERLQQPPPVLQTEVRPLVDPTCCGWCDGDFGDQELARIGVMPACPSCTSALRQRPFPNWLKASAAALGALVVVALVHGRNYLAPELDYLRAQRHIEAREYAAASVELERVLQAAPGCREALLYKIEADLLSDNFAAAGKGLDLAQGVEFSGDHITVVNALVQRSERAMGAFAEAQKAFAGDDSAKALELLTAARRDLPESVLVHIAHSMATGSVRFDAKDWDGFVSASMEAKALRPDDPMLNAAVASALAAKYAATGDEEHMTRALEHLETARRLSATDQLRAAYDEYAERITHRLTTRQIITKKEFDARFRKAP